MRMRIEPGRVPLDGVLGWRAQQVRMRIEPREAQRRGRMSAGAECESRIERHHDSLGCADALVMRTSPQPPAEAHRMKVLEPLTLPDAVGHYPHLDALRVEPEGGSDHPRDARRAGLATEQAPQTGARPETKLSGGGLEHGIILRVDKGQGA